MVLRQAVAGVVLALVVFMVLATPLLTANVTIQLRADARGELLQSLNITITEIQAHRQGFPEITGWDTVWNQTETFDILRVANLTQNFASGSLNLGRYDKLRLFISNATALVNATKLPVSLAATVVDIPVRFDSRFGVATIILVTMAGELKKEGDRGTWSPDFNATLLRPP